MKKNKKIIVVLAALLALSGVIWAMAQANTTMVPVCLVRIGTIAETAELRGKVELDQHRTVCSEISGTVSRVLTDAGDEVQAGTPLLLLDSKDMRNDLERAEINYRNAEAELASLKRSIRPETVRQAEFQVEQANAAVASAQADLNYKRDKYDRYRALADEGGISKQDLKDAELMVVAAENALRDTQERLKIARSNLDLQRDGVSPSDLSAAENRLKDAAIQVKAARENLGRTTINAAIPGTVLKRYADPGMVIAPGTPLFEVGDYQTAYIRVDMLSDDAGKLRVGERAVLTGELLGKKAAVGVVFSIAPKADLSVSSLGVEEQRVEVKIRYDLNRYAFSPGYGLDVKVILREKPHALIVPDKAVFERNGEDYIFVVKQDRLELRRVVTGIEGEDDVEILHGLSAGERVVAEPDNAWKPGMRVKAEETKE